MSDGTFICRGLWLLLLLCLLLTVLILPLNHRRRLQRVGRSPDGISSLLSLPNRPFIGGQPFIRQVGIVVVVKGCLEAGRGGSDQLIPDWWWVSLCGRHGRKEIVEDDMKLRGDGSGQEIQDQGNEGGV